MLLPAKQFRSNLNIHITQKKLTAAIMMLVMISVPYARPT